MAASGRGDDLARFRREYPGQCKDVAAFYLSLEMTAHGSYQNRPGDPVDLVDIHVWGDGARVCVERLFLSDRENVPHWFKGGRDVLCATPRCSITLTSQPDKTLVVTNLRRDESGYCAGLARVRTDAAFVTAPFCFINETIADFLLKSKGVMLTKLNKSQVEGQEIAQVFWQEKANVAEREGHFDFLPNRNWVLHGYEVATIRKSSPYYPKPSRRFASIKYKDEADFDFPLPSEVKFWVESPEFGGTPSYIQKDEVTKVSRQLSDTDIFELAHYDLEPRIRKRYGPYLWLVIGLVASTCGAVFFRYLASRARQSRQGK
ncbi:MAG TPA: hypothetical protein VHD36_02485 [Pirellulales bacterium]|nr:hypothetical protein [Pirellulales bacterium]